MRISHLFFWGIYLSNEKCIKSFKTRNVCKIFPNLAILIFNVVFFMQTMQILLF